MHGLSPFTGLLSGLLRGAVALLLAAVLMSAPAAAQEAPRGWEFDPFARIEAGVVLSESEDQDDELIINGDGGYLRGQIGVTLGDGVNEVRLEADRIEVARFGSATGRDGFNRDRLTVQYTRDLGDGWGVELRGRLYDDLVTIESADADEKQVSLQLEYQPEQAHRVRLRGTWRDREYDDGAGPGGTASTGDGWRVDAEYRHRIGRYHYIAADFRLEDITSDNPLRGYDRQSASLSYTRPVTSDIRVRPAIELRHTRFGGRLTPDLSARSDTQIVPEVELLWWPGPWRIEAEAKYIFGESNDPLRDRRGYRVSLSVGYVF